MRRHFPYLWSHLRPFRLAFLGVGLVLFAQMFLTILVPLPVKYILNNLVQNKAETVHSVTLKGIFLGDYTGGEALLILSLLAFGVGAALSLAIWIEQIWIGKISFRVVENIRRDLFHRIFTRRQSYLDSKKKVDILGRVSGDASNMEIAVGNGVPAVVRDGPMILVLLLMMFLINFQLTLAFSLCLPFFYLLGHYFTKRMRQAARTLRRRTVTYEEETYEAVSSMAIVKSLRGEEKLYGKLLGRVSGISDASRQNLFASQGLETSMGLTQYLVRGGFIFLGSWAIFRGEIGLGDLFQLFAYMDTLARHINNINKFISKFPKCSASMERIEELHLDLERYPEVSGDLPLTSSLLASSSAALEFDEVTFRHGEGRRIFDRYSFRFPKGRLIAIVGQSGIGKSTFSRLLNRLTDPLEGEIRIAGRSLKEFELKSLRALVRVVSQETFLISGSVRENLLLAVKREVPDDELFAALEAVNALGFVKALPEGLQTPIGEGGLQLSGGQAKRIHLARAFLDLDSEILLFDEPTTGLDTLSSQMVMESIRRLSSAKTLVFWVTHRMQEVFSADNVLFFSPSQNPLFSTHEELFQTSTLYRALMEEAERSPEPNHREKLPQRDEEEEPAPVLI